MQETTIQKCEETIVALNGWIRDVLITDYTDEELAALPGVVQSLSQLVEAVGQNSFIAMPTKSITIPTEVYVDKPFDIQSMLDKVQQRMAKEIESVKPSDEEVDIVRMAESAEQRKEAAAATTTSYREEISETIQKIYEPMYTSGLYDEAGLMYAGGLLLDYLLEKHAVPTQSATDAYLRERKKEGEQTVFTTAVSSVGKSITEC